MTEELIAELSRIQALKVVSHTSVMEYKGKKKHLPQIARELGVDGIVEGSVIREGDQVRVTVQLLNGLNDQLRHQPISPIAGHPQDEAAA